MEVKVIDKTKFGLPQYATEGAAGCDVWSNEELDICLSPGDRVLIKTGLFVSIPVGYEIQVRPKSGLALKHGITVLNSPGTIDSDYRGEIGIIVINHGTSEYIIESGQKIGQLIGQKIENINWTKVETLDDTIRNEGGFGSTGL